jgi:hypothetical protein
VQDTDVVGRQLGTGSVSGIGKRRTHEATLGAR